MVSLWRLLPDALTGKLPRFREGVIHECRHCGEKFDEKVEDCRSCGAAAIATYQFGDTYRCGQS